MYGSLRVKLDFPTRRPKERAKKQPVRYGKRIPGPGLQFEETHIAEIPNQELPLVCMVVRSPPPRILSGVESTGETKIEIAAKIIELDLKRMLSEGEGFDVGKINPHTYYQMLAKIAHCFAIAKLGIGAFEPLLREVILGKDLDVFRLIGCLTRDDEPDHKGMHRIKLEVCAAKSGQLYHVAFIKLFAPFGTPEHAVVVGECRSA